MNRNKRYRLLAVAAGALWALTAFAQKNRAIEEYERFRRQTVKEYSDFRSKANEEYARWMLSAWRDYQAGPVIEKPQDKSLPPVEMRPEETPQPIDQELPVTVVSPPPSPVQPQPRPVAPIPETPVPKPTYREFSCYGTPCRARFEESQRLQLNDVSPEELSSAWQQMSTDAYNNTIRDCLELRIRLNLSDWAYLNMLDSFSRSIYGDGTNEARLLTAFLYNQSGYQMRLGKSPSAVYLLWASPHMIFDMASWVIGGQMYYAHDCRENSLQVLEAPYPGEQVMSLWINADQRFALDESAKRSIQSKRYADVRGEISVNKNLIAFYSTYPTSAVENNFLTRWAMYARTPMNGQTAAQLYPGLRKAIEGLSQKDAANRLIDWVQTGFEYKLDDEVWGHDRAFFTEESLYYPYCDCEDRSILFSRLIRDLLSLDVALVYYPGHLATAVAFTEPTEGDYITIDGRKFTIADPTYINAPVGYTMPGMDNQTAEAILL